MQDKNKSSTNTSASASTSTAAATPSPFHHKDALQWLEQAKCGTKLNEQEIHQMCQMARDLFVEESNIHDLSSPITICGDIHGQFWDLLELFRVGNWPPHTSYVFLGDYVDRGHHSVETISLLILLKIIYPKNVTMLRGNHECRQISQVYGFYDEIIRKYGSSKVWKYFCDLFDYLPIGALIDGRVFCIHGGLSPMTKSLDQIRTIDRCQEIPHEGPFCDLMWSDPEDLESELWSVGPRGAGYLFGRKVVMEFNRVNDLMLVARAHQLVQEGYKFMFPERSLVTVWSAPNYCYRCGNVAAIMRVSPDLNVEDDANFLIFNAVSSKSPPEGNNKKEEKTYGSNFIGQPFNNSAYFM